MGEGESSGADNSPGFPAIDTAPGPRIWLAGKSNPKFRFHDWRMRYTETPEDSGLGNFATCINPSRRRCLERERALVSDSVATDEGALACDAAYAAECASSPRFGWSGSSNPIANPAEGLFSIPSDERKETRLDWVGKILQVRDH